MQKQNLLEEHRIAAESEEKEMSLALQVWEAGDIGIDPLWNLCALHNKWKQGWHTALPGEGKVPEGEIGVLS